MKPRTTPHRTTSSKRRRSLGSLRALLVGAMAAGLLLAACGWWTLETRTAAVATRQTAPAFELADHRGESVSLDSLLARGPAVVIFYRGHW